MSNNDAQSAFRREDEIDLTEIWNALWKGRWIIVGSCVVFALGAIIYSLSLTNVYRSDTLLAPAELSQPVNPLLAQFGAAAGLVGISGGSSSNNQINNAIATLRSREFIRQFIEKHKLKPALFASSWDESTGSSVLDGSIFSADTNVWTEGEPTDLEAYRKFSGILTVSRNQTTGLVTLAIDWIDPVQARDWANQLIREVNSLYKQLDQQEASSAIEYLQNQLQATQLVEMQRAFYELIESQTRIVMLADVREDYVFSILDPAIAPEEKIGPNRALICILGTLIGAILSILYLLIRRNIKSSSDTSV